MEKIEPIFKFDGLKQCLRDIGIIVDAASGSGYRPVKPEDVTLTALKDGTYTFEKGGIFLNGKQGEHQQVYLYKRTYNMSGFGKPKMHVRKCITIQDFMGRGKFPAEYRSANTEKVPVRDSINGYRDVLVEHLELCGNCRRILQQERARIFADSTAYVRMLMQNMAQDDGVSGQLDVDIFGYTRNWERLSRAIREKHDWTCERCGVKIENPWDRWFMHVHHKNGIKTDNREENLECLCVRCHANVDGVHRKNFSEGDRKIQLDDFNQKYPLQRS